MKYALILCSLLLSLINTSALYAQVHFNAAERQIITLTDERRNADSLIAFLSSPNIKVAWRAAIGIGNIGDTTVRSALLGCFLAEKRDTVADAEAFALGLLGPSVKVFNTLMDATSAHPTLQRLLALIRAAPEGENAAAAVKLCGSLGEERKIDRLTEVRSYVEAALHKSTSNRMMKDVEALASDDDPTVRWQAAYVFARSGDSLDLTTRLPRLKELLIDQGTPYARMFAATTLGRMHDAVAETTLYRAYKGEQDWRVRVNILNAFLKFPTPDLLIFETIQNATLTSRADDPFSIHVGLTAQQVLEQYIISQKIPAAMIPPLRAWLDSFNGYDGRNGEVAPAVCATALLSAARVGTPTLRSAIENYAASPDILQANAAIHAAGLLPDSLYFIGMLKGMPMVGPQGQLCRLEALDSMWYRANHDPVFMRQLTDSKLANAYRYMLIRVSDVSPDPAVVTTALEHLRDSTIIEDTVFHNDAERYILKYLAAFAERRFRDQLLASVETAAWLHIPSPLSVHALEVDYDSARNWRDRELMDSIKSTLQSFGAPVNQLPSPLPRISHIDWGMLESIPDKIIINLELGSIQLKPLTYYTPLTVLDMVKLAKSQFFINQLVHRVVPNFVIQSGDPTGTGYGGPPFTIRTEATPLEFDVEGVTGMASDGKDTEGSQWFITESPTPHLNTRYTIWAEVISGMDNVLKVNPYEKVETIISFR